MKRENVMTINRTITKQGKLPLLLFTLFFFLSLASCTFDYGDTGSTGDDLPDLVMENVEYVRIRSADPVARFQAERAERYEKQGVMRIQNLVFEQYGGRGEEVNAYGKAGSASVNIESGDIFMDRGVRIEVEAEDIIIETSQIEWRDEQRTLFTGEDDEVNVSQNNGTNFTGTGLLANARSRTWEFLGSVSGTYIYEDED